MCAQMEKMPRVVVTPSGCKASLELAMTIVLLRFTGEDSTRPWSQIASILRSCETYLIAIFQQTGFLLVLHYETLATCLDVLYLQPRLRQFAEAVRDTGALVWPTVLTLDGKTWRSCRPHRSFNDRKLSCVLLWFSSHRHVQASSTYFGRVLCKCKRGSHPKSQ